MARQKLTNKQRKKFFKIRREQGAEAAKEFRQGIIQGKAGADGDTPDLSTAEGAIQAQQDANAQTQAANYQGGRFNWTDPYGNQQAWTQDENGNWTLEQGFSDETQQQYNSLQRTGVGAANQIENQGAYDSSHIAQSQWQGYGGLPEVNWQNQNFQGERQRIEGDLYNRYSDKLGREWDRRREDFQQTLADRGIAMGSEGWNRELESFDEREGYAYDNAMTRAIETGGAEQSRLYGMSLQDLGAQMDVRNLYGGERERDFANQLSQEQNAVGRYQDQFWSPYQQYGQVQGLQAGLTGPNFGNPYQNDQAPVNAGGLAQGYYGIDTNYDLGRYGVDATNYRHDNPHFAPSGGGGYGGGYSPPPPIDFDTGGGAGSGGQGPPPPNGPVDANGNPLTPGGPAAADGSYVDENGVLRKPGE